MVHDIVSQCTGHEGIAITMMEWFTRIMQVHIHTRSILTSGGGLGTTDTCRVADSSASCSGIAATCIIGSINEHLRFTVDNRHARCSVLHVSVSVSRHR
jgi:hypothetical protein